MSTRRIRLSRMNSCLVIIAFLSQARAQPFEPDSNTVALYHFDETSDNFVSDASGNGRNGTATGTLIVDGIFGEARSYGVWTDEVLVPRPFDGVNDHFTIEAWIKIESLNGNSCNCSNTIFRNRQDNHDVWLTLANDGRVGVAVNHGSSPSGHLYSRSPLSLNTWHHVAFTYDANTMRIFINSALDTSLVVGVINHDWSTNYIATSIGSNTADGSNWAFNGIIDELRISDIARTPTTSVGENEETPQEFSLSQNYPNPFNPLTTLRYALSNAAHVTLKIYNMLGQLVATLVDENQVAGYHEVVWDGSNDFGQNVASGIYIYRMTADDFVATERMLLLK